MIKNIQIQSFFIFIENKLLKIIMPISLFMLSVAFVSNNILLALNAILLIVITVFYDKSKNSVKIIGGNNE